jgi:hypothetical protein
MSRVFQSGDRVRLAVEFVGNTGTREAFCLPVKMRVRMEGATRIYSLHVAPEPSLRDMAHRAR